MKRWNAITFACAWPLLITIIAIAQNIPSTFDVASIKPTSLPRPGRLVSVRIITTPGRLIVANATLKDLIAGAYSIEGYQIYGASGWIESARFDVEGKAAANKTRDQQLLMLRAMLTERFKLTVHRESKEIPIDALVVDGKKGPKFRPLDPVQSSCWPSCKDVPAPVNHMRLNDVASLANYLTKQGSGRPVVDRTGLKGSFAIDLDVSHIMVQAAQDGAGPPTNAAIYEATVDAIQQQLGLKVVPMKASMEVVVIDSAEQPVPN